MNKDADTKMTLNSRASRSPIWMSAALVIVGCVIVLTMLRLGVWQLDRAAQKQATLDQLIRQSELETAVLDEGLADAESRFRSVTLKGSYLEDKSIFIDNQVWNKRVGYQVVTPMQVEGMQSLVMVQRGWVAAGPSRDQLPTVATPVTETSIKGRLNHFFKQPPLWNSDYEVDDGARWQFLDKELLQDQLGLPVFPMMVELAPDFDGDQNLQRAWGQINDSWVAKHNAYAFQWFSMALVLAIAIVFLTIRRIR